MYFDGYIKDGQYKLPKNHFEVIHVIIRVARYKANSIPTYEMIWQNV